MKRRKWRGSRRQRHGFSFPDLGRLLKRLETSAVWFKPGRGSTCLSGSDTGYKLDHLLLPMVLVALVAAFDACNLSHRLADSLPYVVTAIAVVLAGGSFLLAAYISYIRDDGARTDGMSKMGVAPRPIVIEESPQPTWRATTPRTKDSPFGEMPRARRGGHRRWKGHVRRATLLHNPGYPNHCAYVCALKMTHRRVSMRSIAWLRSETATKFMEAYEKDEDVQGFSLQKLIKEAGMDLPTYLSHIRTTQWASRVELTLALRVLSVSAYIDDGVSLIKEGHNPIKAIVLRKGHYVLKRMHKSPDMMPCPKIARGGMQRPTLRGETESMKLNRENGDTDTIPHMYLPIDDQSSCHVDSRGAAESP